MQTIDTFKKAISETLKFYDETINLKDLQGKTVIFVIDMVNGFCKDGNLSSPAINDIVPAIRNLLKKAIASKIEIIALNDHHNEKTPEFNNYPIHCLADSKEAELVSELQFAEIKIIKKNSTNGFFAIDSSKSWTWKNIIVVGYCTDICVYQFALTCKTWYNQKNQSINIFVPKLLTATFDSPQHPSEIVNCLAWYSMLKNGILIIKDIK